MNSADSPHPATTSSEMAWYLAYTKPRQENTAKDNLERQGFEVYLPLFKTLKKARKDSAVASPADGQLTYEPMFPRYIFFRPTNPQQSLGVLRSTRGVTSAIMFGVSFAHISPELVRSIRTIEQVQNDIDLSQANPFQPGHRMRLRNPALSGMEGLVQEVSRKRVVLLLEILGRENTLKVDVDQIERI